MINTLIVDRLSGLIKTKIDRALRKSKMIDRKIIIVLTFCQLSIQAYAQQFDSVKAYAASIVSCYIVRQDTFLVRVNGKALVSLAPQKVYEILNDSVKTSFIKKSKYKMNDIRVSFEFYREGRIVYLACITPLSQLFLGNAFYRDYKKDCVNVLVTV